MGNKEVRDILLRRIVRQDERFWTVAPSNAKFHFHGVRDGAGDVHLFGVTHLARNYRVMELEPPMAFAAAEKALNSMGYPMQLVTMPERKGCLYAPNWIAPVLLTIEQNGEELQVVAYTGRSLFASWFRCRVALWILEQRLPENIICVGRNKKADRKETEKQETPKKKKEKPASKKKTARSKRAQK